MVVPGALAGPRVGVCHRPSGRRRSRGVLRIVTTGRRSALRDGVMSPERWIFMVVGGLTVFELWSWTVKAIGSHCTQTPTSKNDSTLNGVPPPMIPQVNTQSITLPAYGSQLASRLAPLFEKAKVPVYPYTRFVRPEKTPRQRTFEMCSLENQFLRGKYG